MSISSRELSVAMRAMQEKYEMNNEAARLARNLLALYAEALAGGRFSEISMPDDFPVQQRIAERTGRSANDLGDFRIVVAGRAFVLRRTRRTRSVPIPAVSLSSIVYSPVLEQFATRLEREKRLILSTESLARLLDDAGNLRELLGENSKLIMACMDRD
jgi:predicted Kef-type K+ transport protein